jgi:excinuclease ABC subunit C
MTATPVFDHKSFLRSLTTYPGIYKMLDESGTAIYVGKAKNLKNRVSSYFRSNNSSIKQRVMISHVRAIETVVTSSENEALLLECQLIKSLKPRYNICLRDDKSYPYIYLSTEQKFPRITVHRGAKRKKGRYLGPYSSVGAVRESLHLLQKVFPIRQCDDSFFKNRSRPCLQHQIERCSAPCTNLISEKDYREDVRHTIMFLEGKGNRLIDELVDKMEQASQKLDFEAATVCRDQITTLRKVLEKQYVSGEKGDLDIAACYTVEKQSAVQVFFIRKGQHTGSQLFYPRSQSSQEEGATLSAFIAQYYMTRVAPKELLVNYAVDDKEWLESVLGEQSGYKVSIKHKVRGDRTKWLGMAALNAKNALTSRLSNKKSLAGRYQSLRTVLGFEADIKRMECFDISHTQGDKTVASCVVFDYEGPLKPAYRRFNIEGITPGDDYAALAQAVERRFKRLKKGEHKKPDVLFIDGGKGQLSAVSESLNALGISDMIVIGVSKGPDRKAGSELLYRVGDPRPLDIEPDSPAFFLIQMIRDEAHRFAITAHRTRRGKSKKESPLEQISGLGPKRRQKLLKQFGGLQNIRRATVESLMMVEGISKQLAQKIYDIFHDTNLKNED